MKNKVSIVFIICLALLIIMLPKAVSADPYEPKEIKVKMDDGSIQYPFFEDYVKQVLPNEMYSYWTTPTLRAGATAARTFAWYFCNHPLTSSYNLTEWSQRYIPGSDGNSTFDGAVNYTQGWRIESGGYPIYARYQAETGNPTKDSANDPIVKTAYPYLKSVSDSHSLRSSSYSGMCQNGAQAMGSSGKSTEAILTHYFTNVSISKSAWVFQHDYTIMGSSYYRVEWWRNSGTGIETTKQYIKVGAA